VVFFVLLLLLLHVDIGVGDKGAACLAEVLCHNSTLKLLDLSSTWAWMGEWSEECKSAGTIQHVGLV